MSSSRVLVLRLAILLGALCVVGCGGPGRVQYDGGRCFRDGRALTAQEVEEDQANVARRISSRQPWFTVITIGVVLLAVAGNAERALLLVRSKHAEGHKPFVERLRDLLTRQRENPALFGTIVGGSLALVVVAGAAYIYLDVDKRTSERALATLQFCHLALRTKQEESDLEEQRHNLDAIESTAGDIRTLVGKLPPEQQRKAQLIVEQMNEALAKQGKIVGAYAARTDEAQKDLSSHTMAMEKGIASVEGELSELKSLPANLKDLEGATHRIDETTTAFDARLAELRERIASVDAKLDVVLARPVCAGAGSTPHASSSAPEKATSVAATAAAPARVQPEAAPATAPADAGKAP